MKKKKKTPRTSPKYTTGKEDYAVVLLILFLPKYFISRLFRFAYHRQPTLARRLFAVVYKYYFAIYLPFYFYILRAYAYSDILLNANQKLYILWHVRVMHTKNERKKKKTPR